MAKIKKIKEGTATVYPATIPQAVVDPTSGKSVRTELNEKEAVANKKQTVTNSATDYPSGAAVTASLALKTDISELNKIYPLYNYNVRVGLDSGLIKDLSHLTDLYRQNISLLDSTVFLWNGEAGIKTRTSGSNTFASKLYNMANKVQQFGAELVTNGTFTTDTSGWIAANSGVLSIDTSRLKVTNGAASTSYAYQGVATVIGKTYHFTFTHTNGNAYVAIGTTPGATTIYNANGTLGTKTISFIAQSSVSYLRLGLNTAGIGDYVFFDNISVKQMDWIEGTNDAIQTTEANQPYFGGLIAPNEVGKLKAPSASSRVMTISPITIASNDSWTIAFCFTFNANRNSEIHNGALFYGNSGLFYVDASNTGRIAHYSVPDYFSSTSTFSGAMLSKNNILQYVYANGTYRVYLNKVEVTNATAQTPFALNISLLGAPNARNSVDILHAQIHNRALSASEIQAQHDFLRLQIPEIEGIAIGNQYWATSNYEGVVAGDGSVIPEVQNSDNVEKSGNLADWRVINALGSTGSVSGNTLNFTNAVEGYPRFDKQVLTVGKWYYVSITLSGDTSRISQVRLNDGGTLHNIPKINNNLYQGYQIAGKTMIEIVGTNGVPYSVTVESSSVQEVGWSQSTALYDAIYAQTSGTAAVKELAALKAAAMWCYYNNDVNNGAIYGKLYNWYAVKLIYLYPPQGYRVPTNADFTQLVNYLGGTSVAGGKMKKEGLTYWGAPNTGATNESGFSGIAGGRRTDTGAFAILGDYSGFWIPGAAERLRLDKTASDTTILSLSPIFGHSLRLLRNSPVGPNEKTITSTTIVSDIASTANSTQIPFGYSVASIRLKTTANLTNIKVELWNNFYSGTPTLVSTLITGKTANNTTMVFPVLADAAALLQDGNLRITATGAATFETIVEYNLQKNTF